MKILIVHRNSFDIIGGAESTLYYMALAIKKLGHTPVILAMQRENSINSNDVCKVLRYTPFENKSKLQCFISPYLDYKNAKKKIEKIITEEKPDFIITRDNILAYVISQFFDKNRLVYVPLVVIKYYNKGIRKFNSFKTFIIEILRYIQMKQESYYQIKAFKNLKKIIVFSKNMKNQIGAAINDVSAITVIQPGAHEKFFETQKTGEIRKEFGITENKKIFLFVGRTVQEKNLEMLINSYANCNFEDTVLLIVGTGSELETLKKQVSDLKLDKNIIFTGARRDIEKFYAEADFFVLPSYYESFGNVILESLAAGVPIIGFKTEKGKVLTAIDELVEQDKNGYICKNFSSESLSAALNLAYNIIGTEKHKDMKKYCRDLAKEKYTWKNFIEKTLKVLKA